MNNPKAVFCPENIPGYKYDAADVARNILYADRLIWRQPRLLPFGGPDTPLLLIGGGPTLNQEVAPGQTRLQALDARRDGIRVLTGSAHRLLDQGKLKHADISLYNAPGAAYADTIGAVHPCLQYWLATQVDPAVIDKLADGAADIFAWDAYVPEIDFSGRYGTPVGAGSTAPTGAVALALSMGHRNFEFYGIDGGSFESLPNEYSAYDMRDILKKLDPVLLAEHVLVEIGGQRMKVATNFWNQAEEMARLINNHGQGCRFEFHGDSLNNMLFNRGYSAIVLHDPRQASPLPPAGIPRAPSP